MRTLQRLIIPALDVCPEVELYVRLSGPATLDVEDREVTLRKGGVVRTDTFFGVFSLGRWGALTSVRRVSVGLDVTGACVLETMVTGLDGKERWSTDSMSTHRHRSWPGPSSPSSARGSCGSG